MRYRLVTTKKGQIQIDKIRKGTLVLCNGKWIPSPKPVKGKVKTLTFCEAPTSSFESKFVENEVFINGNPIFNKFISPEIRLTVMAYLNIIENRNEKEIKFSTKSIEELDYWYPRMIQFYGAVVTPNILRHHLNFVGYDFPKLKELEGNELSERNLEYYLEGLLRRNFQWHIHAFEISTALTETDKLVLTLLGIKLKKRYNSELCKVFYIKNPLHFLTHIKDDYNKSKITDEIIENLLKRDFKEMKSYDYAYYATSISEEEDWILPDINPDINGLNSCCN